MAYRSLHLYMVVPIVLWVGRIPKLLLLIWTMKLPNRHLRSAVKFFISFVVVVARWMRSNEPVRRVPLYWNCHLIVHFWWRFLSVSALLAATVVPWVF